MAWKFDNSSPIYLQIMEQIKVMIAKGELKSGDKVPPVRDMALVAGVNPNTMQKALSELEREGILYSNRTAGRFVADLVNENVNVREQVSEKYVAAYVDNMRRSGFSDDEIVERVKTYVKK
ncbi:MAG: GntR family transcriptional regulator [Lachnospiraceae bacterium]|nr:GntR family transcriptional regulator [Lachnospiraceae bacterium]MBR1815285.1 GntR family transcriptional regulator [Lachnospiraceae bacterium]